MNKLIEELNKCETQKSYENVRYTLVDDELRDYIEESLECLALEQENEKLKKAIKKELALLKERRETFWFTDSYDEYAVVNEIIEEFEEVLGE